MRIPALFLSVALCSFPIHAALAFGDQHGGNHGGGGPTASVTGAGQRQHFSFGGSVKVRGSRARGEFVLIAHPLAPQGTTVTVACRFREFSGVTISPTTATFTGKGKCSRLLTSGEIVQFDATNVFQIVDNPDGDAIDVNFTSPIGIAVPAGALEFGNFTLTPA